MFAFLHFRQASFSVLIILAVIAALSVELDEAVKDHDLTGRAQRGTLVLGQEVKRRAFKFCCFHL